MRAATLLAGACGAAAASLELTLFSEAEAAQLGARCLDGSPSGYYGGAAGAQAGKWVVFLQGGGACTTEADCAQRSGTSLGSSAQWAPTFEDSTNLLSADAAVNPDFHDWGHVYVPYGSGDCHTGTQTEANEWGLYFSGHNTVAAVAKRLAAAGASEVVLSGSSAGGIGVWNNVDFLAEALPGARVWGVPQGGWFFPSVSSFADWSRNVSAPVDVTNATMVLWDSYLDQSCLAAHADGATCGTADGAYRYVQSPLFVAEDGYDTNQIYSQLGAPQDGSDAERDFVAYFGGAMADSLAQLRASDGLFLASCLDHTGNLDLASATRVEGQSFGAVLHAWWAQTGGATQVADDMSPGSLPSNPTCTTWPPGSRRAAVEGGPGRVFAR